MAWGENIRTGAACKGVAAFVSNAGAGTRGAWRKRFYTTRFWLMPKRPPRLDWIFQSYDPPLFFITFNTYRRRKLLANSRVHDALVTFARVGEASGVGVGRYVIMPDHIHLFVRGGPDFVLTQWIRMLKRTVSNAISIEAPHWQGGFFDSPNPTQRELHGKMGIRTSKSGPGRIGLDS